MNTTALPADAFITTTIGIEDMHCAACSSKVSRALSELHGIGVLRFNPIHRQVFVEHSTALNSATLVRQIERAGFHPALVDSGAQRSSEGEDLLRRAGVSALLMMQVMMGSFALYAGVFSGMEEIWVRILAYASLLLSVPVVTWGAVPFYRSALNARRGLSMDTPIALAIVIGFVVSLVHTLRGEGEVYYDAVTMFATFMLIARYIDQRLRDRLNIGDGLLGSLPRTACKQVNGAHETIPSAMVRVGDVLWITEGEQLLADGILTGDQAVLDEASFTGESEWRKLQSGDRLHAGTYNRGPAFLMQVTAGPNGTRLAAIDTISAHALAQKLELTSLTDRVAVIFIPVILTLAALTTAFWFFLDPARAVGAGLAVLVVSCPCALALAVPAAMQASMLRLRQAGIMLKSTSALERLPDIRTICFDKTGTLTDPEPRLASIESLTQQSTEDLYAIAGALEQHTSHPLARAFSRTGGLMAEAVELIPGRGVRGIVKGQKVTLGTAELCGFPLSPNGPFKEICMTIDGQPAARFLLDNPLRADAQATISHLQDHSFSLAMVSGDNDIACRQIANRLGIDYLAGAAPETKSAAFTPGRTLYVGDGINDLPALAEASVSVATLETSDLVKSRADAILLTSRLGAIIDLLHAGRACRHIIRQNLAWAVLYNLIAIPMAMTGFAPAWAAAIGMSASSIIVLLNASRLLQMPLTGRHTVFAG